MFRKVKNSNTIAYMHDTGYLIEFVVNNQNYYFGCYMSAQNSAIKLDVFCTSFRNRFDLSNHEDREDLLMTNVLHELDDALTEGTIIEEYKALDAAAWRSCAERIRKEREKEFVGDIAIVNFKEAKKKISR